MLPPRQFENLYLFSRLPLHKITPQSRLFFNTIRPGWKQASFYGPVTIIMGWCAVNSKALYSSTSPDQRGSSPLWNLSYEIHFPRRPAWLCSYVPLVNAQRLELDRWAFNILWFSLFFFFLNFNQSWFFFLHLCFIINVTATLSRGCRKPLEK